MKTLRVVSFLSLLVLCVAAQPQPSSYEARQDGGVNPPLHAALPAQQAGYDAWFTARTMRVDFVARGVDQMRSGFFVPTGGGDYFPGFYPTSCRSPERGVGGSAE